jgi:LysR family transcriptional regulator, glycine cleavage system transcriptional activator
VLFSEVSAAFELIVGATSRLQRPTGDGDLSINCVPAFLFYWLLPRLGDLKKRLPGIKVKLVSSNSSGGNYSPDTDVSIRYGDGNWPDHWVRLLSSLDLFPVISPSLAMSSPIRATDDLRNHTLLHADQGQEWSDWLTAIGVRNLVCAEDQFLSDAQIALEASMHGYGVALGDNLSSATRFQAGAFSLRSK